MQTHAKYCNPDIASYRSINYARPLDPMQWGEKSAELSRCHAPSVDKLNEIVNLQQTAKPAKKGITSRFK